MFLLRLFLFVTVAIASLAPPDVVIKTVEKELRSICKAGEGVLLSKACTNYGIRSFITHDKANIDKILEVKALLDKYAWDKTWIELKETVNSAINGSLSAFCLREKSEQMYLDEIRDAVGRIFKVLLFKLSTEHEFVESRMDEMGQKQWAFLIGEMKRMAISPSWSTIPSISDACNEFSVAVEKIPSLPGKESALLKSKIRYVKDSIEDLKLKMRAESLLEDIQKMIKSEINGKSLNEIVKVEREIVGHIILSRMLKNNEFCLKMRLESITKSLESGQHKEVFMLFNELNTIKEELSSATRSDFNSIKNRFEAREKEWKMRPEYEFVSNWFEPIRHSIHEACKIDEEIIFNYNVLDKIEADAKNKHCFDEFEKVKERYVDIKRRCDDNELFHFATKFRMKIERLRKLLYQDHVAKSYKIPSLSDKYANMELDTLMKDAKIKDWAAFRVASYKVWFVYKVLYDGVKSADASNIVSNIEIMDTVREVTFNILDQKKEELVKMFDKDCKEETGKARVYFGDIIGKYKEIPNQSTAWLNLFKRALAELKDGTSFPDWEVKEDFERIAKCMDVPSFNNLCEEHLATIKAVEALFGNAILQSEIKKTLGAVIEVLFQDVKQNAIILNSAEVEMKKETFDLASAKDPPIEKCQEVIRAYTKFMGYAPNDVFNLIIKLDIVQDKKTYSQGTPADATTESSFPDSSTDMINWSTVAASSIQEKRHWAENLSKYVQVLLKLQNGHHPELEKLNKEYAELAVKLKSAVSKLKKMEKSQVVQKLINLESKFGKMGLDLTKLPTSPYDVNQLIDGLRELTKCPMSEIEQKTENIRKQANFLLIYYNEMIKRREVQKLNPLQESAKHKVAKQSCGIYDAQALEHIRMFAIRCIDLSERLLDDDNDNEEEDHK